MSVSNGLCARCQVELETSQEGQRLPPLGSQKLSSCYIPSDAELAEIPSLLEAKHWQQDIDHYSCEIDRLSAILAALRARRDELQRDMDQYKAFISPFRRIPAEILTEIFSFCCCDGELNAYGLEISRDGIVATTLALSQTCSLWRSIVRFSPRLWSRLSVNLAYRGKGMEDLIKLYLHHSGDVPLDLNLFGHDTVIDEDHPEDHYAGRLTANGWSVLLSILQEHRRWYDVRVDCPCDILNDYRINIYACNPANGHFDTLRSLTLVCEFDAYFEENYLFRLLGGRNAPLLECLDTNLFIFEDDLDLQFSHLRKLTVRQNRSDWRLLDVFQKCTNLKEATILTDSLEIDDGDQQGIVIHEKLRSLKIEGVGQMPFDAPLLALSFLTLPALTTLDLTTSAGSELLYGAKLHLTDMLVRSSCALQELRLSGELFESDEDLLDVLQLTPTVTCFVLNAHTQYRSYFTRNFFHNLTFDNARLAQSSGTLLPSLKKCRFAFRADDDRQTHDFLPDVVAILSMLASRRSLAREQLETFELSAHLFPDPDSRVWVRSLESAMCSLSKEKMILKTDVRFFLDAVI
ncbi:hypothetical protein VKT23_000523 [Stygiomarasmius scandens]|uniref:F-box domain-containing protein n=1 Tax=Marasmiellus scandens TaxID=2682957 RepID=A0ABR1K4Q9_9AGAR